MERGKREAWSSFFGGTGFYIALVLCVMATAAAGYFLLFGGQEEPQNVNATTDDVIEPVKPVIPPAKTQTPAEPAKPTSKPATVIVPKVEPDPELEVTATAPAIVVSPLRGETVSAFSVDALQYNETLGDWRTHDGVDISAPAGTPVAAASAGTVRSVTEDGRLGTTVVIEHPDGHATTYASLEAEPAVAVGDAVSAGQQIGTVGNTSLAESALGAHLHFSVTQDGKAVDPAEYLPKA